MGLIKRLATPIIIASTIPAVVIAEGLERANIDTGFLYEKGTYAEFGTGQISPSLPATFQGPLAGLPKIDNVAPSFSISTGAFKTQLGDSIDVGIWYSTSGNGVNIDWGSVGATTIFADVTMPTVSGILKYNLSENISVLGGIKQTTLNGGSSMKLPLNSTTFGQYTVRTASASGAVYGVSYQRPDIALRVEVLAEEAINLSPTTDYFLNATALSGEASMGVGDALTLKFQTGIAPDTLLFGSVRDSKWKNNQVGLPTLPGAPLATVSTFEDGQAYTLGIGRRINENLSVSASLFSDPSTGGSADTSELAPTYGNNSISLGAKIGISENANLSIGGTYSMRGDVSSTSAYGAKLSNSTVTTIGAKISYNF
jgi:long-subunit fatty acid transport protein